MNKPDLLKESKRECFIKDDIRKEVDRGEVLYIKKKKKGYNFLIYNYRRVCYLNNKIKKEKNELEMAYPAVYIILLEF